MSIQNDFGVQEFDLALGGVWNVRCDGTSVCSFQVTSVTSALGFKFYVSINGSVFATTRAVAKDGTEVAAGTEIAGSTGDIWHVPCTGMILCQILATSGTGPIHVATRPTYAGDPLADVIATISGDVTVSNVTLGPGSANVGQVEITDGTNVLGTAAHPVRVDPTNATTTVISAAALPLPTGAALETGNLAGILAGTDNLAAIKADTDNIPPLGQALAASSVPVVLTALQQTALTPPAALTNYALEAGGNLAAIKADVDKIPSQGQALAAACTPVVLPASQITTLTPPAAITGFALDATLTGGNQQSKITDGTNVANVGAGDSGFNYQRVGWAARTYSAATSGTGAQYLGNGQSASNTAVAIDCFGYNSISVQITAVGGSTTIAFAQSNDNATWPAAGTGNATSVSGTSTTVGPATSVANPTLNSVYNMPVRGRYFQISLASIASGTLSVVIVMSTGPLAPLSLGVAANIQTVNATTVLTGNGTTGSGSQRVTIASDNTAFSVNSQNTAVATGGLSLWSTPNNNSNAGLTNSVATIKASAGRLEDWMIYNSNASAVSIQIFDVSGSVTLGTTRPNYVIELPTLAAANVSMSALGFANAIKVAATTTASGSAAPSNAVDCSFGYA